MEIKTKQNKYNPKKSFWATKKSPIGKIEKKKRIMKLKRKQLNKQKKR